ncbi:CGG triplet repeat-binding protein 1, partial [Frankliniella fusca]
MPPKAVTVKERIKEYKDDGGLYEELDGLMYCKFCAKKVDYTRKDSVSKHVKGESHLQKRDEYYSNPNKRVRQQTIQDSLDGAKRMKEEKHQFILDTVEAFISANIPVSKLDDPAIRQWLFKYVKRSVLRENYIPEIAQIHMDKIKESLKGKDITLFSDETTDKGGRCVYNVLFQTLDPAPTQDLYLASSTVLDSENASNCAKAVLETLAKYEKNIEEVAAFNADSARYMTKCFKTLNGLHEELLHIQCLPHKLHHVGNTFQKSLPELNLAVKHTKRIFLNARKRKNNYMMFLQDRYPDEKHKWRAFPSPIRTRWNSWKESVNYIEEYFDDIIQFVQKENDDDNHNFEEEETEKLKQAASNLSSKDKEKIKVFAEFVKVKGLGVETVIKQLQSQKVPTGHVIYQKLDIVERKMAGILSKNVGWFEDLPFLSSLGARKNDYIKVLQSAAGSFREALVKY